MDGPEFGNNLESQIPKTETQESLGDLKDDVNKGVEENKNLSEISQFALDNFKELGFREGLGEPKESFELFTNFLDKLPDEEKNQLLKTFNENLFDIGDYFSENGYIINEDTFQSFKQKYEIANFLLKEGEQENNEEKRENNEEKRENNEEKRENNEEKRENNEEKQETKEERSLEEIERKEKLDTIESIWLDIEKLDGAGEFADIFNFDAENITDDKAEAIITKLENELQGDRLNSLLDKLKKADEDGRRDINDSNSLFNKVSKKLISVSPVFSKRIDAYRSNINVEKNLSGGNILNKERIKASFPDGVELTRDGNILKGGDVTLDLGEMPPRRYLGGENYKLESSFEIGDYYPAIVKYEKVKQNLEPKLSSLEGASQYLQDLLNSDIQPEDLVDIKKGLKELLGDKLSQELGIDYISNIDNLKNYTLTKIQDKKQQIQEQLNKAKQLYKNEIRDLSANYRETLNTKDEKVHETLSFLNSIGFDMIPQSITNQIIETINSSNLGNLNGLSTDIDLANGVLGANRGENDREVFIKFFNKMLTGSFDKPITDINHVLNGNTPDILQNGLTSFNHYLESNPIVRSEGGEEEYVKKDGIFNIGVLLKNVSGLEVKN